MKMKSFTLLFVLISCSLLVNAQDTLTGWDFSDNTDVNFYPTYGLSGNMTYDLRAEDSVGTTRPMTYTNGATDYAATATNWDNGADNKFWSVKFKADGYINLKVSSKLSSGGNNAGPKFWKLQCKKSGGAWMDITGGTVTVANNWTTGVVNQLALPSSFDNPGTTSLYIRWIMTSNESVNGGNVQSTGIAKIDDILVTGVNSIGIETHLPETGITVYPNPTTDLLQVHSTNLIESVRIFDATGMLVISEQVDATHAQLDVSNLPAGIYAVAIMAGTDNRMITRKIMVRR